MTLWFVAQCLKQLRQHVPLHMSQACPNCCTHPYPSERHKPQQIHLVQNDKFRSYLNVTGWQHILQHKIITININTNTKLEAIWYSQQTTPWSTVTLENMQFIHQSYIMCIVQFYSWMRVEKVDSMSNNALTQVFCHTAFPPTKYKLSYEVGKAIQKFKDQDI